MNKQTPTQLSLGAVAVMAGLALLWGANMAVVKLAAGELPPLLQAGLRSLVGAACLYAWMRFQGVAAFEDRVTVLHGLVTGLMFGAEFGLLYPGMILTSASRSYLLLYTSPFFVAVGAHYWLPGDRLNAWKASGLVLAFGGLMVLFSEKMGNFSPQALLGDLLSLGAGALWGATTLYLKRYLVSRALPTQLLFYQLLFSALPLLAASLLLEGGHPVSLTAYGLFSLFYQAVIVAFLSYLVWFKMIHFYPVSLVQAFTFFSPVAGVFLSGLWLLGEPVGLRVFLSLGFISLGLVMVNRPRRPLPA
ncbi:MAG: DMT family transporter [Deltaproteobacteria bacterium]|nr:DMT family transporter [Deltaproteobacteria bacterium]